MKLSQLPEHIKDKAIKNARDYQESRKIFYIIEDRMEITSLFNYSGTPEGWDYWHKVDRGNFPEDKPEGKKE